MGTHPIFESDFDCLTDKMNRLIARPELDSPHSNLIHPSSDILVLVLWQLHSSHYTFFSWITFMMTVNSKLHLKKCFSQKASCVMPSTSPSSCSPLVASPSKLDASWPSTI